MAILATVLCSPLFGIIAIVYAYKINNCNLMGDYAGAKKNANRALTFSIIAAAFSLLALIFLLSSGIYA